MQYFAERRRRGIDRQACIGWEHALLTPPKPIPEEDN